MRAICPLICAALRRRVRAEEQELAILAAKRARGGGRARELGALTLGRGLDPARTVALSDGLLQPSALARVLRQRVAAERKPRSKPRALRKRPQTPEICAVRARSAMRVIAAFISSTAPPLAFASARVNF